MSQNEELPEYNPYAVPESIGPRTERAVREFSLAPGQEFRVFGRQLICRNHGRFANVCWLTGATDVSSRPLVWKGKLAPTFFESWWVQVPYIGLLLGFAWGDWPPWAGFAVVSLVTAQALFTRTAGEQFKLSTGQSTDALQNDKRLRWFFGIQIPVCVWIVVWVLLELNQTPLMIWMFAAIWLLSSMVYWFRSGLIMRSWQVRRYDEDSFIVSGLRPEFLKALYIQQWTES